MVAIRADATRWLGQADVRSAEDGPLVAVAEGGQAFDLTDSLVCEHRERRFGIYEQFGDAVFGRDAAFGFGAEIDAKGVDCKLADRQAGCSRVTAVAEQML